MTNYLGEQTIYYNVTIVFLTIVLIYCLHMYIGLFMYSAFKAYAFFTLLASNQIKSNQILFKVRNVHLKEKKN